MVTDQQVRLYLQRRGAGVSQEGAAAYASMSAKTARKWEDLTMPSLTESPRTYRTRPDPLCDAWDRLVVPLLAGDKRGKLQAPTILGVLKADDPEKFGDEGLLRTVQRRLRDWRALYGPAREVYFEQDHPPGREAQIDFTHAEELNVTIYGAPFPHLFFELILSCSGWRFTQLCFGETIEALERGVQDGLWSLGGVVRVLRSDNLSAATHELRSRALRLVTKRFAAFLGHFGLEYTRINVRKSNENGVVEKAHDTFKNALEQALIVRQSRDFLTIDSYCAFAQEVRLLLNSRVRVATAFIEESKHLLPLPSSKIPTHTDVEVTVRKWSTIRVRENNYSVPSRLMGHRVVARVHPDTVELIYNDKTVEVFPRLRGRGQSRIDYRHIIHSLVRKPGAFARWRYREELFPSLTFRQAYDALRARRGERGDVEYLRVLELAATTREADVETALQLYLESNQPFGSAEIADLVDLSPPPAIVVAKAKAPDLGAFDGLLTGELRASFTRETPTAIAC
jgi:hypothetical protein